MMLRKKILWMIQCLALYLETLQRIISFKQSSKNNNLFRWTTFTNGSWRSRNRGLTRNGVKELIWQTRFQVILTSKLIKNSWRKKWLKEIFDFFILNNNKYNVSITWKTIRKKGDDPSFDWMGHFIRSIIWSLALL